MKRLLLVCGLLWSALASAQFTPGQLLTAQELNSQFLLYAPLTGATFSGTVVGNSVTQSTNDNSTLFATDAFVNQQIIRSTTTVPLTIAGGTYNQATLGSGFQPVVFASGGVIGSILTIAAPGTGYAVGDLITLAGGNADATIRITSIGAGGSVTAAQVLYGGTGYSNGAQIMATPIPPGDRNVILTGVLTSNVTFIIANGTFNTASRRPSFVNNTTGAFTVTVFLSNGADGTTGSGYVLPQGITNSTSVLLQTDGKTDVWPVDTSAGIGAAPIISANTTLNVPSQFSTIQAACNYLGTVVINTNASVTIQVANGTYSWSNIECAVPQGDQVSIIGNTTTPASVVINVNNANNGMGFQFYRGQRIHLIDGFTINGTAGWVSHCSWNTNVYGAAFDAYGTGSGTQIGAHVVINKMYYGVLSDQGASISSPTGLTITEAGDAGVLARWSGSVDIENATSTNTCDTTAGNNLGFGFLAEVGGSGHFDGGTATGNNVAGAAAQNGGAAWAHNMTLNSNTYGLYANEGGNIEGNSSTITGGTNGVQSNDGGYVNVVGVTASGASGSGMNAANSGIIDAGAGATANTNPNGFTQFTGGVIYGTLNGTGNTFNLFVNGNAIAGTTITASSTITPSQTAGIVGTTTNNNANAGSVGEYISSTVASGSAVSLTSGTPANVTSISLTAGDWDVFGAVDFNVGATTVVQLFGGSASTTSATNTSGSVFFSPGFAAGVTTTAGGAIPTIRLSLASTTTVYLVAQSNFTVSTMSAYGFIGARRRR